MCLLHPLMPGVIGLVVLCSYNVGVVTEGTCSRLINTTGVEIHFFNAGEEIFCRGSL